MSTYAPNLINNLISFLRYDEKSNQVPFQHVYKIINEGPSHTNKPTKIEIYFPVDMITLTNEKDLNIGGNVCKESGYSESFETGSPSEDYTNAKSCDTVRCVTYECNIDAGWEINTPKEIEMDFVFDGKKASEDTDNFNYAIFSNIRINGEKGT